MNKKYLLSSVTAGIALLYANQGMAQCVSTQDCATLGYTETSCPNGNGVKCPFGNKWFCGRSDEQCMELACDELGFKYDCVGTNIAGGEGTECNGKYVACKCASGYGWQDSSCQEIVMNGPDGEVYRCNGSVLGVKTADMDFYVAMYDSGKVEYDDIGNTTYSFCADTPGVIPTKEQLLTIYKNHERINELLSQYGGDTFDDEYYWSNTWAYENCVDSVYDEEWGYSCVVAVQGYYVVNLLNGNTSEYDEYYAYFKVRRILTKF